MLTMEHAIWNFLCIVTQIHESRVSLLQVKRAKTDGQLLYIRQVMSRQIPILTMAVSKLAIVCLGEWRLPGIMVL